jgi:hypothetical protein
MTLWGETLSVILLRIVTKYLNSQKSAGWQE